MLFIETNNNDDDDDFGADSGDGQILVAFDSIFVVLLQACIRKPEQRREEMRSSID